jgi:hypothetical protein
MLINRFSTDNTKGQEESFTPFAVLPSALQRTLIASMSKATPKPLLGGQITKYSHAKSFMFNSFNHYKRTEEIMHRFAMMQDSC